MTVEDQNKMVSHTQNVFFLSPNELLSLYKHHGMN
jgi:hypothetical protein